MDLVTKEFHDRIEAKVRELEKVSSLEFVPVIVRSSAEYGLYRLFFAVLVFAFAEFFLPWLPLADFGGFEFLLPIAIAAIAFGLTGFVAIQRMIVPMRVLHAEVEEGAALHFLKEEVFATRARTGVLIYVSLFERSVYILADRGVTAKIPAEEWAKLGGRLAADFRHDSPGTTFLQALDEIVARVATDFPHGPHDANELPDKLREY